MNEHSGKTVVKAVIFALVYPGDTECTNDILFYFLWPAEGKTMISWNDTFWIIDNIQLQHIENSLKNKLFCLEFKWGYN